MSDPEVFTAQELGLIEGMLASTGGNIKNSIKRYGWKALAAKVGRMREAVRKPPPDHEAFSPAPTKPKVWLDAEWVKLADGTRVIRYKDGTWLVVKPGTDDVSYRPQVENVGYNEHVSEGCPQTSDASTPEGRLWRAVDTWYDGGKLTNATYTKADLVSDVCALLARRTGNETGNPGAEK